MDNMPRTLLELLDRYKIEIPIVQRDYAQGRKDDHATRVRENLLHDMKLAIDGTTPSLDLNFIYGKVIEDKFIPLDGQQRLTTLYLLHLYAFKNDESKTEIFNRFTYETRISSREFLKGLNQNRNIVLNVKDAPSLEIEDSIWFVPSWKYDPTIQSVLTMLDEIHKVFKDVENLDKDLYRKKSNPILFNFLDIENLGMEDTLYIKLNARGKPLTDLENFKAQLIGRLKRLELWLEEEFQEKLDGDWTDLFWSNSKKDFDKTYLNFFGVLFMNKAILKNDNSWSNDIDYEKIDRELFENIFHTLNFIYDNPKEEAIKNMFFNALTERRTYQDRILFHGITTYLSLSKGVDEGNLNQWVRIVKNLTLNSELDEFTLYRRAIEGINNMAGYYNNIIRYFSDSSKVSGFSIEQIEEERRKAKIILEDKDFANLLYDAEKHKYFSGQVRSALYYSQKDEGQYSKEKFVYYWEKITLLFDESKPIYGNLLRRALLTLGDYTLPVSRYKTFCVDDSNEASSTPSMKRLFSNHGEIVKAFLDKLDPKENMEEQLEEMIKSANISQTDWRYCFVNYPFLFNYMSGSHLRLRSTRMGMLIIPNKSSSGYNSEVYLLTLKYILNKKEIESELIRELGAWSDRYIKLNEVFIRFKSGQYVLTDRNESIIYETRSNELISEIEDYITNIKA